MRFRSEASGMTAAVNVDPVDAAALWSTGEVWDPFTKIPSDARWWRRVIRHSEVLEYQLIEPNSVHIRIRECAGGPVVADLRRDRIIRMVVVDETHWPPLIDSRAVAIPGRVVLCDVLAVWPAACIRGWQTMTDAGDHRYPYPRDPYQLEQHRRGQFEMHRMWVPRWN